MIEENKLNALIEDEKMAHAEYKKLKLPNLAKDELKHYHFLLRKRKEWYGY